MPMLEVRDLNVHYGAIHALHGINVQVEQGQIVTLIGSNGAGKSTTLRTISGLLRPTSGQVLFEGKPIAGTPAHKIVQLGVAHSPEGRGIFANLTVDENLDMGAFTRRDHDQVRKDREKALNLFPRLRERLKQVAGTLSGGEQQQPRAGEQRPGDGEHLLLDEPSLGLAPQIVQTIFRIIREINAEGTTILLVEQNAHMALKVAHRAYVLEVGRIVMEGPAAELAASDEVRRAYLGHG
jgi:branched-chain amino acid transport system ATP-binding protein